MLSGLLLIDKEKGPTSHDVVEQVRKILKIKQVGHAGTLDPFATGLLLVGFGKATRLLEYLQGEGKIYQVKMKLGLITDTFDITGNVMEEHPVDVGESVILEVVRSFIGKYAQVPPAYSARKYQGKRLYELAREGKIINLPPRDVEIYEICDVRIEVPYVEFTAKVSAGTYIRSLCMDIGYKIGCGATAVELRRISVGKFKVDDAVRIDELKEAKGIESSSAFVPIESMLNFPKVWIIDEKKVYNGMQPKVSDLQHYERFEKDDTIQIFYHDKLIALAMAERSSQFIDTLAKQGRDERIATLKKVIKTEGE
ncbi:MAG TPA: tRNA pseudouridine(55) synthase TruB [Fervidobacterium sp.]|nr:tRNA pseudouridine(55) synthase TruB [Fervidobacterium sp.]HON03445.1 tRNA pseudouridine(55) synthase TruB [Fervidobacterium sp.]HQI93090.1 tRNA pseudouridine(55) synthase TruB [Fervidobacterium sp.]HRT01880.1 tRNA pseudouridine(55) synthase TruB [Fervidobacterium sp.]HRV37683.1 tRNA pseudouridine(55) synthase TruB [Fervidobacterium sp.]